MELVLVAGRFPERSETFIYRKAVALAKRGHRVTMLVRQIGDWSLYPQALPDTLRVEELPPEDSLHSPRGAALAFVRAARLAARSPADALALRRRLGGIATPQDPIYRLMLRYLPFVNRAADALHFEFLNLAAMYALAPGIIRAPLIVSCRGSDVHTLEHQPPAERDAMLECLRRAVAVHCVSQKMSSEVTRLTGRTSGLWVNRPAVDTDAIAVRSVTQSTGTVRMLATGRLVWKKGFDYLLAAMGHVVRRGLDVHLDIVGDGELKSVLRSSIRDLELERHVSLVGAVSSTEVLARMRAADIFVLSSVAEGISNAVLEAMASGLPIVTTDAGGMAEAVTDGIEGFVVPVRQVGVLADRIEALARHHELRVTMGQAARARAVAEFSLERQVETFEAMYRSASGVPS